LRWRPNTAAAAWRRRYCDFLTNIPAHLPRERKFEQFLTVVAKYGIAASTQNQAFNAILFFYKEVLGEQLFNIHALRANRPVQIRRAPAHAPAQSKRLDRARYLPPIFDRPLNAHYPNGRPTSRSAMLPEMLNNP